MRRPHLAHMLGAAAAASVMVTAGCTTDSSATTATVTATLSSPSGSAAAGPSPKVSATTLPSDGPASEAPPAKEAPFVADLKPDTSDASAGALLSPVNVRFAVHDGYDRIVLDLVGTGQPGWLSEYDNDPRMEGSGEPVDLAGAASLVTHVKGIILPTEPGASAYVGSTRFSPESAGVVDEVVVGSIFEGQFEVYIGMSSPQPFRVFLLEGPTRLVIDVQHP